MIRSYKVAFVALFVGLLVLTMFAVSVNTYRHATRVSLDFSADILSEMSAKVIGRTSEVFEAARDFAEINALIIAEQGLADHQALFRLFGQQLALRPQLESLYVASPDGDFIQVRSSPQLMTRLIRRPAEAGEVAETSEQTHGEQAGRSRSPLVSERIVYRDPDFAPIARINGDSGYDPRQRAWYRQAMASEGLQWSRVYRFANTEIHGITAARAVRAADGSLLAVVGVDISLGSLSQFLTEQRVARGGIALILDAERRLIAIPRTLKLRSGAPASGALPSVDDLQMRWLVDAYHHHGANTLRTSGINRVAYSLTETQGQRYLGHRQAFPPEIGNDWELMIVVPEASLLESARRLFSEAAAVSLMLLVIATTAVSYLALRLFQPLKRLVRNTELIREFRFADVKRVPSRFTEIKAMDEAIWKMSQGLRSLEKFVPKDVGRQLIKSGKRVEPGAEVRELSLLLTGASDLASLCAALPPARITALLSRQLDVFTDTILRHKGTIDNFLGESILAFWGAPVAIEDSVDRACRAALACRDAEGALHAEWAKTRPTDEPAPSLNLFSIHHGRAIVGAIGSRKRMSWTAIGDNVALGWDLHQLNRRYGTRIIISGEARRQVADRYWTRRLDVLPLSGGARQLEVFELIERRERALPPDRLQAIASYEAGLKALLAGDWETAEAIFTPLAEQAPDDLAVALMMNRCSAGDACFWPGLAGPRDDLLTGPFATRARAGAAVDLSIEHPGDDSDGEPGDDASATERGD